MFNKKKRHRSIRSHYHKDGSIDTSYNDSEKKSNQPEEKKNPVEAKDTSNPNRTPRVVKNDDRDRSKPGSSSSGYSSNNYRSSNPRNDNRNTNDTRKSSYTDNRNRNNETRTSSYNSNKGESTDVKKSSYSDRRPRNNETRTSSFNNKGENTDAKKSPYSGNRNRNTETRTSSYNRNQDENSGDDNSKTFNRKRGNRSSYQRTDDAPKKPFKPEEVTIAETSKIFTHISKEENICPVCEKEIHNLFLAIKHKESGKPAHFHCILDNLVKDYKHKTSKNRKIYYIGAGKFALVKESYDKRGRLKSYSIIEKVDYENSE